MIPLKTLWHYLRTRRLVFDSREALLVWQQKKLRQFARKTLSHSPWFKAYAHLPHSQWPLMNKALMMANFDQMNTAGLKKDTLLACAQRAERDRHFTPQIEGFSVGLSSGTSGQRGIFVVSPHEQQVWAGGMLAKMLPKGLRRGERVAMFLRADNNLYHSVNNRWLSLAFFDLFSPFQPQLQQLENFAPTIIVAPAQVLRQLALAVLNEELTLSVSKAISVAEVLTAQDRQLLEQVFPQVGEVYQATEGFLAATCERGTLHLNEEFIHIEPEWIDDRRFVPVITDFTRHTQPIVRYRLDDVLVKREQPCGCGRVTMSLQHVEGRCDDWLELPGSDALPRIMFADACSRVIANALPLTADYRLTQQDNVTLMLQGECSLAELQVCKTQLEEHFGVQAVDVSQLQWILQAGQIPANFMQKKRRITRLQEAAHG
ncbi:F390 synthetase-related protein [Rahnella inusitata]|uniref:F390 synthetase-related protein n=1 Tax=Rahnella inusitata TaxID=58169 RepID=UPI0039AF605A